MPIPFSCRNPDCCYHQNAPLRWYVRFGFYHTTAHGMVQRYRCRMCGKTASSQTDSLHYYAKRRLPLSAVWASLVAGAPLREVARRYHVSPMAMQNAVLRLGRQAMSAQLHLLEELSPRDKLVFDGLRSSVTSNDFPCDITTVVEREGETILTMAHTIFHRGGQKDPRQRQRLAQKLARWRPKGGTMKADISLIVHELWDYLRPPCEQGKLTPEAQLNGGISAIIDTDEHPLYRAALARDPVARHFTSCRLLTHRRTPSTAPRTRENPLFPVNYVDRLLRHRVKEHTRETIAIGRHATIQMHRAWIFACDHNTRRPRRVRRPQEETHAGYRAVAERRVASIARAFFTRRIRPPAGGILPETMRRVWFAELPTPPVRWRRRAQRGTSVRIPAYARRDLAGLRGAYQQGR